MPFNLYFLLVTANICFSYSTTNNYLFFKVCFLKNGVNDMYRGIFDYMTEIIFQKWAVMLPKHHFKTCAWNNKVPHKYVCTYISTTFIPSMKSANTLGISITYLFLSSLLVCFYNQAHKNTLKVDTYIHLELEEKYYITICAITPL